MDSNKLFKELSKYLIPSKTPITIPFTSFKSLYDLAYKRNTIFKAFITNTRCTLTTLKEDVKTAKEFAKHMKVENEKVLGEVIEEYAKLQGNLIGLLLHFNNCFKSIKEQLMKASDLIDSSTANLEHKENSGSRTYSKTAAILKPIKQFISLVMKKVDSSSNEMNNEKISKGAKFEVLTKDKLQLSVTEQREFDALFKNPIIKSKYHKQRPPPTEILHIDTPPSSLSSCSVTELEEFVYELIHKDKLSKKFKEQFSKEVSLEDLLALSKESTRKVSSPLETTEGCLKELELMSKEVAQEFDAKKIKKIEFSDNKVIEHTKVQRNANDSIDNIALDLSLRNQTKKEILKYNDYINKYKEDKQNKFLDSAEMSADSLMSSFDLPNDTKESYASIITNKGKNIGENIVKVKQRRLDGSRKSVRSNEKCTKIGYSKGEVKKNEKKRLKRNNSLQKAKEVLDIYYTSDQRKPEPNSLQSIKCNADRLRRSVSSLYISNGLDNSNKSRPSNNIGKYNSLYYSKKKVEVRLKLPPLAGDRKSRCLNNISKK